MIYLIKQPSNKDGWVYIKIGYADDLKKRVSQYEMHCPGTLWIAQRPGDLVTEKIIHKYFHLLPKVEFIKNEWYHIRVSQYSGVLKEFHQSTERMERIVWRSVSKYTDIQKDLWEYLFKKYGSNGSRKSEFDELREYYESLILDGGLPDQLIKFFREYSNLTRVSERLKRLCEIPMTQEDKSIVLTKLSDSDKAKYLYQTAGPERCRTYSYAPTRISKDIEIKLFPKKEISNEVYKNFTVGTRISLLDIKSTMRSIYSNIGYEGSPKASDIQRYFNIKKVKFQDSVTGKWVHGYELLSRLLP